jgi:leucyl aminopeptidase (aminopeptidase T)
MFVRTVPIDYTRLRADCGRLCKEMKGAHEVRVTAPGGTDITIGTRGRKPKSDDGDYRKAGRAGNVPSGEVYVSPALGTANGVIAFDGSIVLNKGEIVIRRPIETTVKGGFITKIDGGREASMLLDSVRQGEQKAKAMARSGDMKPELAAKYAKNAWSIGELGIGLNRKAKIIANLPLRRREQL